MKITPITTEDGRHLLRFEAEPGDPMTAQEAAESAQRYLSDWWTYLNAPDELKRVDESIPSFGPSIPYIDNKGNAGHLIHYQGKVVSTNGGESFDPSLVEEMADLTPEVYEAAKQRYLESPRVPPYANPQRVIGNFMGHPVVTDDSMPPETFFFRSEDSTHAQLSKANDTLRRIREAIQKPISRNPQEVVDHIEYLLDLAPDK